VVVVRSAPGTDIVYDSIWPNFAPENYNIVFIDVVVLVICVQETRLQPMNRIVGGYMRVTAHMDSERS